MCSFLIKLNLCIEGNVDLYYCTTIYFLKDKKQIVFLFSRTSCINDTWNVLCQMIHANIILPRWDLFIGEPHIHAAFHVGSSAASPHRRVASHRIGTTTRREIVLTNLHLRESYVLPVHARSTKRGCADRARLEFGGKIRRRLPLSLSLSLSGAFRPSHKPTPQ